MKYIQGKAWFKSRTIWLNVIGALLSILVIIQDYSKSAYIVGLMAFLNVLARFITNQPITLTSLKSN